MSAGEEGVWHDAMGLSSALQTELGSSSTSSTIIMRQWESHFMSLASNSSSEEENNRKTEKLVIRSPWPAQRGSRA